MALRGVVGGFFDYVARILQGKIADTTRVTTSGKTTIATTGAVPQDIWPGAAVQPLIAAAGVTLEVLSGSANDTAAGTGMQAIIITGLDINYNPITATVNMNGVAAVAIPGTWLRVNSARGTMVTPNPNTTQFNAGIITIRDSGGGTTRGIIPLGEGVYSSTLYTVPAGFTLAIHSLELQITSSAGGTARGTDAVLVFRNTNGFATASRKLSTTDSAPYALWADTYIPVLEKVDFWMRCTYTSVNNMTVGGAWEGHLHRN